MGLARAMMKLPLITYLRRTTADRPARFQSHLPYYFIFISARTCHPIYVLARSLLKVLPDGEKTLARLSRKIVTFLSMGRNHSSLDGYSRFCSSNKDQMEMSRPFEF
jgi:hypothetical protein